ncbi:efflux RND transporter permease subunit [Robiginitomaculum antarcticum]|uniref:efflux RND transporter permease subunit n=1 Tax=Robiginitomaculum antarcticum TaxID=437507 RepID=UPI00035E892F|nr:efflux RND transporter permease subunit [Robiginitomaculum antarcticum]
MKNLIRWFVRNPVAANLIMVLLFVGGIVGYFKLEREFIPQTTFNGMTISVSWPGASPRDVNEQIIARVEEAIDGLDGIDYIESSAYEGGGSINVRTKLRIDYEKMYDQVKSRVDGINNLPPDIYRPQVFRWDARVDIMYLALHGDVDRLTLQRLGNDIRLKLTNLPGLQLTNQVSKLPEQVTIEVSEEDLRRYDLTFSQVSQAISGASVNLSAGSVETSSGNLQLRARSLADSKADFENIVVRQTPDGGKVYVRDIATVIDGFDDEKFNAEFRGEPTAIFQVLSPDTSNITQAGKEIREFERNIQDSLPPGVSFSIWFDGSKMVDSRMNLIGSNALFGLLLVLITLLLFLRPAVAFWVTIGIATTFAGAIAVAPYLGISLNMISLFAFLLVIGIVVDDAIVVGESAHFHNENGIGGAAGAIGGANMVVKPVFFAVITTIMMFVPWMLITGPMNSITSQISLVVIAVLVFSLIEAFFILPAHLRHLKPIKHDKLGPVMKFQQGLANSLNTFAARIFRPLVALLIKFRYFTVATFIGLMVLAIGLLTAGIAPVSMFPEVDGDMVQFNARFPEGTNYERIEQVREQLDAGIMKFNANVKKDFGIDEPLISHPGTMSSSRQVEGYLGLIDANIRKEIPTKDIADKLEEYVGPIPDAYRVQYGFTEGGNGNGGGLWFAVSAPNGDDLNAAVLDIKGEMETYGAVTRAWDGLESSAKELQFTLQPGAETLGITLQDLTRQVRGAFYGVEVQRLPRNGQDVRVMVRYPTDARENIDSLRNLRIRTAAGVEVPLYSVADVTIVDGVSRIRRRDRQQVEYTGARVRGGPQVVTEIKNDMEENFFPQWELRHPRVNRVLVGDDEMTRTMGAELRLYGIMILVLMYMLLAIAFKSYAQPFLIMVAIPFALVGMIFGNIITGVPFGMMSLFGLFAAAGVAVNDNLVLIDYVNRLRSRGVGAYQAMLDSCVARFRPILLTSVTTFIGVTPILFETSAQAEFLKPMVVALAYGVLFDFFLTLMLVPAMYGIGVDITRMFRGWWHGERQPGLGSFYNPEITLALDDLDITDIESDPHGDPVPAE